MCCMSAESGSWNEPTEGKPMMMKSTQQELKYGQKESKPKLGEDEEGKGEETEGLGHKGEDKQAP